MKQGFKRMATTQDKFCDICELQHKTTPADVWCPECEEFMCNTCKVHHSFAKSSKDHKIVKMADAQCLPSFVLEIKTDCAEHSHKLELFCPKHEVPFCTICTPKHQDCGEITAIRQVIDKQFPQIMADIEQNLKNLREGIEAIYNDRQTNLHLLMEQEVKWRRHIQNIKMNLNEKLDKLERTILEELETLYVHQKGEIENFVKGLNDHKEKADKLHDDIVKIKQHASEIQTFLSALKIQDILQKEDVYMKSVITDKRISQVEISFSENPECLRGEVLSTFGKLTIVTKPSTITLKRQKEKKHILRPLVRREISQLRVKKTIDVDITGEIKNAKIEGCTTTDSGRILLADHKNNQIIVLSPDGIFIDNISLKFAPNDIVHTKGITFVSSSRGKSAIRLDIESKTITKEIIFERNCDALSISEDRIIIRIQDTQYKILDFNLSEVGIIPISKPFCPYLSYLNNKLYLACWKENVVYCYDMEGKVVWQFKDPNLKLPRGIGIDGDGNVYVSGFDSHNILVISPHGDDSRVLVDLKHTLKCPSSIDFNLQRKTLLVTSNGCLRIVQFKVL